MRPTAAGVSTPPRKRQDYLPKMEDSCSCVLRISRAKCRGVKFLRDGIVPAVGKGVAAEDAPEGQKSATKDAVLSDGLGPVLRTGGNVGAFGGF